MGVTVAREVLANGRMFNSSWEGWSSAWQAGVREGRPTEEEDDLDYTNASPATAGEQLFVMLKTLKIQGILSARQACILAFWAKMAGAGGACVELALKPDYSSGDYSRHFDKIVGGGPTDRDWYNITLSRKYRFDRSRCL